MITHQEVTKVGRTPRGAEHKKNHLFDILSSLQVMGHTVDTGTNLRARRLKGSGSMAAKRLSFCTDSFCPVHKLGTEPVPIPLFLFDVWTNVCSCRPRTTNSPNYRDQRASVRWGVFTTHRECGRGLSITRTSLCSPTRFDPYEPDSVTAGYGVDRSFPSCYAHHA